MWIITKHGFVSIVQHHSDAGRFLVRARDEEDLKQLLAVAHLPLSIAQSSDSDYRYRTTLSAAQLGKLFDALALSIDYPNFKNHVGQDLRQRKRLPLYHQIWHLLQSLQS